jgi:hypothetical protein
MARLPFKLKNVRELLFVYDDECYKLAPICRSPLPVLKEASGENNLHFYQAEFHVKLNSSSWKYLKIEQRFIAGSEDQLDTELRRKLDMAGGETSDKESVVAKIRRPFTIYITDRVCQENRTSAERETFRSLEHKATFFHHSVNARDYFKIFLLM